MATFPTLEELIAANRQPGANVDVAAIGDRAVQGMDLAATIQNRKQSQEDRVRALQEKIEQAKKQRALTQAVKSNVSPVAGLAADVDPAQASRQILEKEFSERTAKAEKQPTYTKIGEANDEIILADLADPAKQFRVKAPGIKSNKEDEKIRREAPKAKSSLDDALREYNNMITLAESIKQDPALPAATGIPGVITGRIPGTPTKRVAAQTETLKSKTLLNVLSALKQLSATGATGFGQLSNIEGENIRQSVATLDRQLQSGDFAKALDSFQNEMEARKETLKRAYEETYGPFSQEPEATNRNLLPESTGGLDEAKRARLAELRAKKAAGTLGR